MFAAKAGKTQPSGGGGGGGGGGGSVLDSQIVGVGVTGSAGESFRGFDQVAGFGTCTDGTSNIYSGAAIRILYHDQLQGQVRLVIAGSQANSGWSTMTTSNGHTFTRSSASYSTSGGNTRWIWTASNPFVLGQNITCTFT